MVNTNDTQREVLREGYSLDKTNSPLPSLKLCSLILSLSLTCTLRQTFGVERGEEVMATLTFGSVGLHPRTRRHIFFTCTHPFKFSFLSRSLLPFDLFRYSFFCVPLTGRQPPSSWSYCCVMSTRGLSPFRRHQRERMKSGKKIIIGEWREKRTEQKRTEKGSNCVELIDDSRELRTSAGWWSVEQKRIRDTHSTTVVSLLCVC